MRGVKGGYRSRNPEIRKAKSQNPKIKIAKSQIKKTQIPKSRDKNWQIPKSRDKKWPNPEIPKRPLPPSSKKHHRVCINLSKPNSLNFKQP